MSKTYQISKMYQGYGQDRDMITFGSNLNVIPNNFAKQKVIVRVWIEYCNPGCLIRVYTLKTAMTQASAEVGSYTNNDVLLGSSTDVTFTDKIGAYMDVRIEWNDAIASKGIFIECKTQDGSKYYSALDPATHPSYMIIEGYKSVVTPSITSKASSLQKGGTYNFTYTTDNDGSATVVCGMAYRQNGDAGNGTTVYFNGDPGTYAFDTNLVNGTDGMQWRICCHVNESGTDTWSDWQTIAFTAPSVNVEDMYPTSAITNGIDQNFRWALAVSQPSAATSNNVRQAWASIQWRVEGATDYKDDIRIGGESSCTVGGGVFPIGSIEWRVYLMTNTGFAVTSAWRTIQNREIAPTSLNPTGTLQKGGAYTLSWGISPTDGAAGIAGIRVEYRSDNTTQATGIELGAGARSATLDTVQFTSITGMLWRVVIRSRSGHEAPSPWITNYFTAPSVTMDDWWPTGTIYHGYPVTFRWATGMPVPSGATAQNARQLRAVLDYRAQGATDFKSLTVDGAVSSVKVAGDVLPIGQIDWRISLVLQVGFTVTSAWHSANNIEIPISVTDLYPAASARAMRGAANRFGWTVIVNGKPADPAEDGTNYLLDQDGFVVCDSTGARILAIKSDGSDGTYTTPWQVSALMQWRLAGSSDWTNVSVTGTTQFVDIPANTLPSGKIEWMVTVTANTGTVAKSDISSVSTLDTLSIPIALIPAGEYLDDTVVGVTFAWRHVNESGTAQTGWELRTSDSDGVTWTTLASGSDNASGYTAAPKTFSNRAIYWQIRTKNTDGAFGSWSVPAIFAIRRAPYAPRIVYTDDRPLPTIKWQSEMQTGYEIELDGETGGMRYGTEKAWKSKTLLANGDHLIRVRVINAYRDVSIWSAAKIQINNKSAEVLATLIAEPRYAEVQLRWTGANSAAAYLIRDGKILYRTNGASGKYTDRTGFGNHRYFLRSFDTDGNYTDSAGVEAAPEVPIGAIGLLDGTGWTVLRLSEDLNRYDRSDAEEGAYRHYWGTEMPRWEDSGRRIVRHTIRYVIHDAEMDAMIAMRGKPIVYKDCDGHVAIGVFDTLTANAILSGLYSIQLTITEVAQEELVYDL